MNDSIIKNKEYGDDKKWDKRILVRYWLIQLPGIVLFSIILYFVFDSKWINLPRWLMWVCLVIWIAKDAILYPLVWRSYDWINAKESNMLIGSSGIVKQKLNPIGYVKVYGEIWKAKHEINCQYVNEGEEIQVKKIKGLTLIVSTLPKKQTGDKLQNTQC